MKSEAGEVPDFSKPQQYTTQVRAFGCRKLDFGRIGKFIQRLKVFFIEKIGKYYIIVNTFRGAF